MTEEIKALLQALLKGKILRLKHNSWAEDLTASESLRWISNIMDGSSLTLRIEPATITVNGIEVPAPETIPLEIGASIYIVSPMELSGHYTSRWCNDNSGIRCLHRGIVYLNKEDAAARAAAEA